jgi:cytochrome P450 family 6
MQLILIFITFISIIFYLIKRQFNYWKNLDILYEVPSFPYGNIKDMNTKFAIFQIHQNIYEKFKKSGSKFVGIFYYLQPVILVTDIEFAKNIFTKDSANFIDRGSYYNEKDNPISAHLFNLDNPKWRTLRTKLTPTFTSGKIKMMFNTVIDVGERFVQKIESEIQHNGILNVRDYASRFTIDVIGK